MEGQEEEISERRGEKEDGKARKRQDGGTTEGGAAVGGTDEKETSVHLRTYNKPDGYDW